MMPIVPFSMFFDPILAEELQGSVKEKDKITRVEIFQRAYGRIMRHASGEEKLPLDVVQQYTKTWRETILSGLQYIDDTMFIEFPSDKEKVDLQATYAYSTFAKPGTHKMYLFDP
jgi:hypothetical protein